MKEYFQQDVTVVALALAYGFVALGALALFWEILDLSKESDYRMAVTFLPFIVLPGVIVFFAQLFKPFWGKTCPSKRERCDQCNNRAPLVVIRAPKVTGLLIAATFSEKTGWFCRGCAVRSHLGAALHNGVFGWWGIYSAFATPGFVLHNVAAVLRDVVATPQKRFSEALLLEEKDYAKALLETKEIGTVETVLAERTGLPIETVKEFLTKLD